MKIWFVKPNKTDYDLYDGGGVVAETSDEAEKNSTAKII